MKQFFIFLFFALPFAALSQEDVKVEIRITDCESSEVLPFANIYSLKFERGTASNALGIFTYKTAANDTLSISFIGYKTKVMAVKDLIGVKSICLVPRSIEINPIEIAAKSTFLYELLAKCKRNRFTKTRHAKSYLLLKSMVNGKQVELLEAYYNGLYRNHNVEDLKLKIGRIFLAPYNEDFFLSLSTSRGLNLHGVFESSLSYPTSPLALGKNGLIKQFNLNFHEKFSQNGNTVYVIDFKPKTKKTIGFEGRIWLDSTRSELLKIKLKSKSARRSPFIPVGFVVRIDQLDFDITKRYKLVDGERTIESVDFNYEIHYTRRDSSKVKVNTEAILFAYDYKQQFTLPSFEKSYFLNDYQNINLAPYNSFFWEKNKEFKIASEELEKELYLKNKTTNYIDSFSYNNITHQVSFTETTYQRWNEKRIKLSDIRNNASGSMVNTGFSISDKYELDVKIYMDINTIDGVNDVQLSTIFDPFTSYCFLDNTPQTSAFVNMYFDLIEIEKRELAKKVKSLSSVEEIKNAYSQSLHAVKQLSNEYFSSVLGGKELLEMEEWNRVIEKELGINNLKIFKLLPDNK